MFRFIFCAVALIGFATVHAEGNGKQRYRGSIRHIESGGIGYEVGYTTFAAFLASDPSQWPVTPFLDARGHVFDNGKWAANVGAGLRTLWKDRAYGLNTYYDYRNAGRFHANQLGVGLETLGELFDFRINGYLPVGAKTSSPYAPSFGAFSGHYLLVSQKIQSAMKGADAEFGFHFGKSKSFDFYAAAGPYYFIGEEAPSTWGGKARIGGIFKDILTLEISDSYDRTFHNKFQGQISLSLSLGPKSKVQEQGCSRNMAPILNERLLQPVARQEIIVIDNTRKNSVAINPATGLPYFFVFVDNTGHSDGTYESPYHSFAQAQSNSSPNDILYVFPGDGTTTGMDSGITLKTSQKFWGSGVSHPIQTSVGTISIPAQSNSSPIIANTNADTEGNAITLATHNAISGFTITSAIRDAIYGADSQSLEVSSCTIENAGTFVIEAIFSDNASISLMNNQFLNNANGVFLTLNGTSTLVCSNNTMTGQTSVSECPLNILANSNTFSARIENNLFNDHTTGSIKFNLQDVVDADITLLNNTITNNGTGSQSTLGSSFVIIPTGTTDHCSILLENNTFSHNDSNSLYVHTSDAITALEVTASSNTISDNGGGAIVLSSSVDALTLVATDNTIARNGNNGISVISNNASSTGNITINNNSITIIGTSPDSFSGIAISQPFSTLNLNILNNEINTCTGSGILCYSAEFTNLNANITGNGINDCTNVGGGNAASGISLDTYVNLTATVANNTLSNNGSPSVGIGINTGGDPNVCLTLTGNSTADDYQLTNPGVGHFNLSPLDVDSVNVGNISTSGTITPVQSCPP